MNDDAARVRRESHLAVGAGPETGRVVRHMHVDAPIPEQPHAQGSEGRLASTTSADPQRLDELGIGVRERIPAAPGPNRRSIANRRGELSVGDSQPEELGTPGDSTESGQRAGNIHDPIPLRRAAHPGRHVPRCGGKPTGDIG